MLQKAIRYLVWGWERKQYSRPGRCISSPAKPDHRPTLYGQRIMHDMAVIEPEDTVRKMFHIKHLVRYM